MPTLSTSDFKINVVPDFSVSAGDQELDRMSKHMAPLDMETLG
jgi:hypothetical protein